MEITIRTEERRGTGSAEASKFHTIMQCGTALGTIREESRFAETYFRPDHDLKRLLGIPLSKAHTWTTLDDAVEEIAEAA